MPHKPLFVLIIGVLLLYSAGPSTAAFVEMEWADDPGSVTKTLAVGETATINIRLELIAGEEFGYAKVPLAVGTWFAPDDTPNFQVTGYAAEGELGSGHHYDRSRLPVAPFAPEDYWLDMGVWGPRIAGPAVFYLDSIEILAVSPGHDDIVFGETLPNRSQPDESVYSLWGSNGDPWTYGFGYDQSLTPEFWDDGVGDPGQYPTSPHGGGHAPRPLMLNVVPEPATFGLLCVGAIASCVSRRRARS